MINEQTERYLQSLIRVGTVTSTNPKNHTVRVVFPESDNDVSWDLPVLCRNSFDNSDTNMMDVGEDVLCIFLPGGIENGFVIGSFYAGEVTAPTNSQDKRMTRYKDGTTITYDRASHELDIEIGKTHIHADRQTVNINTPKTVNITTTTINVEASADINLTASGNVNIKGATINLN